MEAYDSTLARKLAKFVRLGPIELEELAQLEANHRPVAAGTELVREREIKHCAYILEAGWACSYKLLPDGGRQVIDFPIPGNVIGLRSLLLRTADHSIAAVTDVTVAEVSARQLVDILERVPRLAAALLWGASRDEAVVVEHLVNIGRRRALVRTAHFLVEMGLRLKLAGLGSSEGYACPLSQYILADALGLTAIHLNRVLRQLREQWLVTFQDGQVTIHDFRRLSQLADHYGGYLDQANDLH